MGFVIRRGSGGSTGEACYLISIRYKKVWHKKQKKRRQPASKNKKKERQARGRPSYKPSDKDRNQVETMVGLGLTADDVCNVMGFSRATLFKYFRDELAVGYSVAKTNVTQKAFEMETNGKTPAMTMFWLKCRAGWRETHVNSHEELPPVIVNTGGSNA